SFKVEWHRAVFTNLVKPGILLPEDDPSTGSDSELSETVKPKKINIMSKMWKTVVRLTAHHQQQQQLKALDKRMQSSHHGSLPRSRNIWGFPTKYDLVPRISRDVDSQKPFPGRKASKTIQVDVDVVEAETARIVGNNLVVRSHRMSRRVSVTSLPAEQQKAVCSSKKKQCFKIFKRIKRKNLEQNRRHSFLTVGKLQAQVDELVDTVSEKSMRLLAQRHAELQQCENLGDEILQSSKQFQRVSKRSAQKYKWKNCFLCGCCC
uniref:V-SNARE coiled-coil homology domain-containing protein n=1 Tax=Callorhinchus milii TaxID=7868 RepID=A0A4W3H7M9_CALMI